MKKIIIISLLILGMNSAVHAGWTKSDPYQRPNPGLTFDQVAWLATHNAFTNTRPIMSKDHWVYGQQHWTIKKQLENGVRALMLDIHEFDKGRCKQGDCKMNCDLKKHVYKKTSCVAGCDTKKKACSANCFRKCAAGCDTKKKVCKGKCNARYVYSRSKRGRCKDGCENDRNNCQNRQNRCKEDCKNGCESEKASCQIKQDKCVEDHIANCESNCEKDHPSTGGKEVLLCHGERHIACCGKFSAQKFGFGSGPKKFNTFKWSLETIKKWLDENPQEIVTIFLEQYVGNDKVNSIIESVPGLAAMTLTREAWNPHQHGGAWPTLQWMIDNNKRLVVYGTKGFSGHLRDLWSEVAESQYGEVDPTKACVFRSAPAKPEYMEPRSKIRPLVAINFFKSIASEISTAKHNKYKTLKNLHDTCTKTPTIVERDGKEVTIPPILSQGKHLNYLGLDFVDEGNPMKLINELNAEAARKIVPQQ